MSGPAPKLKTAYKQSRSIAPLHTSGPVALTPDGSRIFTCVAEEVLMTDVQTGEEICRFAGDTQSINSLCVSPSGAYLLVFTSSLSLRIFDIPSSSTTHTRPIHPARVISRAHDAPVHVCKTDPTSTYLASGSADGVVKVWDIARGYVTHVFKGHGGVVSALTFNYPFDPTAVGQTSKMQLITASVDTRVRIFDLSLATVKTGASIKPEAVLEGHVSVPRGLDVTQDGKWLVSGGRDSVVLIWDISSTRVDFDAKSGGKGKGKGKVSTPVLSKTIPALERVEAVGFLQSDEDLLGASSSAEKLRFYTAGQKGIVKIWNGREGNVLFSLGTEQLAIEEDQEEQREILNAIYIPSTSTVVSVHADQNILFHSLSTRSLTRQLIGFNDEIIDAVFLASPSPEADPKAERDTHIAFATNSSLIRVYSANSLDARLLSGHKEIVLALEHSAEGRILASASKDRTARLWAPQSFPNGDNWGWGCVAVCVGHAESVGAIAMSRNTGESQSTADRGLRFMFTGSQDRTIKMWDLSEVPITYQSRGDEDEDTLKCKSLTTLKAHDKDINSLDISPNDRLLASGSQDRTAKIYAIEYIPASGTRAARGEIKLIGTCKGHKRGVWTVKFGTAERVLATGSGDKTIKLWNLDDFSCVKTFEGHTNSVLRVDFINLGMQLVSTASDGLVKLWSVREEECVATMDNHEDKVWALAISQDEQTIISGAADSVITFWEDCTEEEEEKKQAERADLVLKEQDFMNYLALSDYRQAIQLALAMKQPGRLFNLFKNIRSSSSESEIPSFSGHPAVDEVLRTIGGSDLTHLLRYIRDWNANAKTSEVAQSVLFAIVKLRSAEDVMNAFVNESDEKALETVGDHIFPGTNTSEDKSGSGLALKELLEALIPYTERHLARLDKLVQESYMVDYVLGEMDDGMFDGDEEDAMDVDGVA